MVPPFEVRAQHTLTLVMPSSSGRRSFVCPARDGDAHVVDPQGRTLCGLDAQAWKRVTSRRWANLGKFRCGRCLTALAPAD